MKYLAIVWALCGALMLSPAVGDTMHDKSIPSRWSDLWNRLEKRGANGDQEKVYRALTARYTEPHRAYHNLNHIEHALNELDRVRELAQDPIAVEFALWFHDVIYNIGARNNEEKSARFAKDAILEFGLDEKWAQRVSKLILATRHETPPTDLDARLVVDIDISILGQSRERFDAYERAIRHEYAPVIKSRGIARFNSGRATILRRFLGRPMIYSTDYFKQVYEEQARANLRHSIERLEGTGPEQIRFE